MKKKTKLEGTNDANEANEFRNGADDKKNSEFLQESSMSIRSLKTSHSSNTELHTL